MWGRGCGESAGIEHQGRSRLRGYRICDRLSARNRPSSAACATRRFDSSCFGRDARHSRGKLVRSGATVTGGCDRFCSAGLLRDLSAPQRIREPAIRACTLALVSPRCGFPELCLLQHCRLLQRCKAVSDAELGDGACRGVRAHRYYRFASRSRGWFGSHWLSVSQGH